MKLKEIVSCYLTKAYDCDKETFDEVVSLFSDHANTFEADWRKFTKSEDKVVFEKGSSVALTFDYSGAKLEVQVIFEYNAEERQMKLSVGNWGFPFEPLMSKTRYLDLLENIHTFVVETGKVEEAIA